jgi:hypothetical protein
MKERENGCVVFTAPETAILKRLILAESERIARSALTRLNDLGWGCPKPPYSEYLCSVVNEWRVATRAISDTGGNVGACLALPDWLDEEQVPR